MAQSDDAVECIGLIRRLGGPVADLQALLRDSVPAFPCYSRSPSCVWEFPASPVAVPLLSDLQCGTSCCRMSSCGR